MRKQGGNNYQLVIAVTITLLYSLLLSEASAPGTCACLQLREDTEGQAIMACFPALRAGRHLNGCRCLRRMITLRYSPSVVIPGSCGSQQLELFNIKARPELRVLEKPLIDWSFRCSKQIVKIAYNKGPG